MKKFFIKLHLWLSIPVGLVISVICFSGAALVFEKEITRIIDKEIYFVEPQSNTQILSEQQVREAIASSSFDTLTITSVKIPQENGKSIEIGFKEKGKSRLCINPYTAEPLGWTSTPEFFKTMRSLHRFLMDNPAKRGEKTFGKVVVGVSTLIMVFVLISGIIIWVPKGIKALKNRLTVKTRKGLKRFLYDSHVALGIYAALFLLIMALTGLTWSFKWYKDIAYSLIDSKSFFYMLHTGSWGGFFIKILYFLSAIIGGTLPLTGYYLWIKKRYLSKK